MPKRERGSGGLFLLKGCKYWYAQVYDRDGRPRRMSTRTTVKQEALAVLRNRRVDSDKGAEFLGDSKKIRYEDLRGALLQNYVERGNKSLMTMADGSETIWGLKALDEFFKEWPVMKITTDAARDFAKKRLADGALNGTINRSLALLRRMIAIAHEDGKIQNKPQIRLLKPGPTHQRVLP